MRRRAVSHDVRRLPQRLRNKYAWEKQQSGGDVPAAKRPSRKHRFHMTEKWGYKIPDYPNDK